MHTGDCGCIAFCLVTLLVAVPSPSLYLVVNIFLGLLRLRNQNSSPSLKTLDVVPVVPPLEYAISDCALQCEMFCIVTNLSSKLCLVSNEHIGHELC